MKELWRAHSISLEIHNPDIDVKHSGLNSLQTDQVDLFEVVDTLRRELSNL